jgi:hypothetical protein
MLQGHPAARMNIPTPRHCRSSFISRLHAPRAGLTTALCTSGLWRGVCASRSSSEICSHPGTSLNSGVDHADHASPLELCCCTASHCKQSLCWSPDAFQGSMCRVPAA